MTPPTDHAARVNHRSGAAIRAKAGTVCSARASGPDHPVKSARAQLIGGVS